jgi:hypothetical protein
MCKEIFRKIPIFMLESVRKFHCGYWNVLEMSTVPVTNTCWKIPSALLFGPATSTIYVGILPQSL